MRIWTVAEVIDKFSSVAYRLWGRRLGRGRRMSRGTWDRLYRQGRWDFLSERGEESRYRVLVDLCLPRTSPPRVLDVGCGEGILLDHFYQRDFAVADYLGLDLSTEAISRARQRHPAARFEVADVESYRAVGQFDLIILNECLYYFGRPAEILDRLATALAPGGWLIVSMYAPEGDPHRHARFWEIVESRFARLHGKVASNDRRMMSRINAYELRQAGSSVPAFP